MGGRRQTDQHAYSLVEAKIAAAIYNLTDASYLLQELQDWLHLKFGEYRHESSTTGH